MKMLKLSDVYLNEDNPRKITDARFQKLKQSIIDAPELLEMKPIILNDENVVLGGNQRVKALRELGYKKALFTWYTSEMYEKAKKEGRYNTPELEGKINSYEDACKEIVIKDNVGYGEDDWEKMALFMDIDRLEEIGVDTIGFDVDEVGEDFELPDGEKEPFQQMTFTLSDAQAEFIKDQIKKVKNTDDYLNMDTEGNENSNGNALYLLCNFFEG